MFEIEYELKQGLKKTHNRK